MYIFPLTAEFSTPHVTTLHSHFPCNRILTVGQLMLTITLWNGGFACATGNDQRMLAHTFKSTRIASILFTTVSNCSTGNRGSTRRGASQRIFCLDRTLTYEFRAHLAIEAARNAGVPLVLVRSKNQIIAMLCTTIVIW